MGYELCILGGKNQGESFKVLSGKSYIVGKHSENDIIIADPNISRTHFKIQIKNNKYFITDLGSKNGTFVDGRDLTPGIETEVRKGVPIVIGTTILGFGEMCKTCLKPFLGSAGLSSEIYESGEAAELKRVMAIKKNLEFIYNTIASDLERVIHKVLDMHPRWRLLIGASCPY